MSVRRLIATLDPGSVNVSAFCAEHGIGRSSFYAIRRRFEAEGESGLEPRSRAPKRVANRTSVQVEDRIVELRKQLHDAGHDAGPATIWWHLDAELDEVPSESTIWRILKARGFIIADPSKRPKRTNRRFAAERANEVWQIDGTTWELGTGVEVKIINIIDDGSRLLVASRAHPGETFDACWDAACAGAADYGWPHGFLCDNGRGLASLERAVAKLGIRTRHSRPYHPQTCGKVERFHQTLKKWLAKQPAAHTIAQLQTLLNTFRDYYNHERPHRAIGRQTPASQWQKMPKTGPARFPLTQQTTITHNKVSHDGRINSHNYLITIGAAYKHQPATTITTGTHAHIFINGQLIRELTIDPTTQIQSLHPKPGRPPKDQP